MTPIRWSELNRAQVFDCVGRARQRALLLDYDGTLAPFHVERDQAIPYPGVREALKAIQEAGHTRLVVISGRWIQDLKPLLGIDPLPEIWGSHGSERLLSNGIYERTELDARVVQGLAEARAWVEAVGLAERCEYKPFSLALHWRGLAPQAINTLRDTVLTKWEPLANKTGLDPHQFDGGIELRDPERTKGFAVKTILTEMGPGTVTAYLGDDTTDEDAFMALSGNGLSVLVRGELRPTAADLWLRPPDEMLEFLGIWQQAATSEPYKHAPI